MVVFEIKIIFIGNFQGLKSDVSDEPPRDLGIRVSPGSLLVHDPEVDSK